jgi:hypothetical protein
VPGTAITIDEKRIKQREGRFEDIDARVQDIKKRHDHRADIRGCLLVSLSTTFLAYSLLLRSELIIVVLEKKKILYFGLKPSGD